MYIFCSLHTMSFKHKPTYAIVSVLLLFSIAIKTKIFMYKKYIYTSKNIKYTHLTPIYRQHNINLVFSNTNGYCVPKNRF